MAPSRVRWLRLRNVPLLRQLRLEEALFRSPGAGTWVVTNAFGSAGYDDEGEGDTADGDQRHAHAIAMGISGKPELLLNEERVREARVPIIRRFTGGGTVVLDRGSLMVSLVSDMSDLPGVAPFPNELMAWTAGEIYAPLLAPHVDGGAHAARFGLREQDYCLGERKCGGNAQAISGGRWVHHTSFLWDFEEETMGLLKLPAKRPAYRGERAHADFLVGLSSVLPDRRGFWTGLGRALESAFGAPIEAVESESALALAEAEAGLHAQPPPRIKTAVVDWPPAV
jgi:lipoate-protein ligase A